MKKEDEIGEKKIPKANAKDSHRWTPHVGKKAFKCKFKALEEGIFEMASVKNAAQMQSRALSNQHLFTWKSLKKNLNWIRKEIKYIKNQIK